jgi:hypothetical protein
VRTEAIKSTSIPKMVARRRAPHPLWKLLLPRRIRGFILTIVANPVQIDGQGKRANRPLETTTPGRFAAGNLRHGSGKRWAAAVGAGGDGRDLRPPPLSRATKGITYAEELHPFEPDSRPAPAHSPGLRGVPQDRQRLGSSPPLSRVRPRGLLRLLTPQARHQTLPPHPASHHAFLRTRRDLGLVLHR